MCIRDSLQVRDPADLKVGSYVDREAALRQTGYPSCLTSTFDLRPLCS